MATTYTTKPAGTKIAVYRHTVHYPHGVLVTKFGNQVSADAHIARQVAEDCETRARKVADYLAERAARPAPVVAVSDQLELI